MSHTDDLIGSDIESYLRLHERKGLLRFITCGSVDDGKSTLIGRLLFDSKMLFEDHLAAVTSDSRKWGTQGDQIDFALLVDGLAAEREQGITIDVAYRFFSTEKRKFIVADTPGHEQYTRNMVTGASTADVAVLMVDARKGILTQTRRHSYLVSMLGIDKVIVAVNKMDLMEYRESVFREIQDQYATFAANLGIAHVAYIPVSAFKGDNIYKPSAHMPWYTGSTLMGYLETVEVQDKRHEAAFRMPVQWVNRPDLNYRGYAGTIAGGSVQVGDRIRVLPSGKETTVSRIATFDGDLPAAIAGQSVTLSFQDEVDASRGDLVTAARAPAEVADQFEAVLVWMHEDALLPGRSYLMKIGARTASASVMEIKYQVNVNSLEHVAAKTLGLNAIGVCTLHVDRTIAFDAYTENRQTGGFILIDRLNNATVGAGMLRFALRRSHNIHAQHLDVNKEARSRMNHQKACVIWFTGLSGAGKSTIANELEKRLHAMGHRTYLLDGDNVRHGLNKDLGFTDQDRVENIRRVAEVARLMVDAGLIVLSSFISPFEAERRMARSLLQEGEFFEVFVDAPLAVAESRDAKGLYRKARQGLLKNFTGIDSRYEEPADAEVRIRSAETTPENAALEIIAALERRGILSPPPIEAKT